MRRREFNQSDAAKHFDWHESVISQYLTGERRPNLENAIKIEELTGIPAKSWLSTCLDNSSEPVAAVVQKRKIHKA
jgi:transcriptional regulator with XRE-family HTH domain